MSAGSVMRSIADLQPVEIRECYLEEVLEIIATPGRRIVAQSRRSARRGSDEFERPTCATTAVDLDTRIAYRATHEGRARGLLRDAAALNPAAVVLATAEVVCNM